jgi:hypothetical protein
MGWTCRKPKENYIYLKSCVGILQAKYANLKSVKDIGVNTKKKVYRNRLEGVDQGTG